MDLLRNMAGAQGCDPSGTASRNPLSKLVDGIFETAAIPLGGMPDAYAQHPGEQVEFDEYIPGARMPPHMITRTSAHTRPMEDLWADEFHRNPQFMTAPHQQQEMMDSIWMEGGNSAAIHTHAFPNPHLMDGWEMQFHSEMRPMPQMPPFEQEWMQALTHTSFPEPSHVSLDQKVLTSDGQQKTYGQERLSEAWEGLNDGPVNFEDAWEDSKFAVRDGMDSTLHNVLEAAWEDSKDEIPFQELKTAWQEAQHDSASLSQADYDKAWASVASRLERMQDDTYTLTDAAANPYTEVEDPMAEGMLLYESGRLREAVLAFEAQLSRDPENAEAWRMLGTSHAENDEDRRAIVCLKTAVDHDPYHLQALLALGVSYVNELDSENALAVLKSWVQHHPKFQGMKVADDDYGDGTLMDEVVQLMLRAQEVAPDDADVLVVLGVLYNVTNDLDAAIDCFKQAVTLSPNDYSIWNKLGATLANNQKSDDAIPNYANALKIKPRYARGWLNLGISYANLSQYEEAARAYLQALHLNPGAKHIWGYLRVAFTWMERMDLVHRTNSEDVGGFRDEFDLMLLD